MTLYRVTIEKSPADICEKLMSSRELTKLLCDNSNSPEIAEFLDIYADPDDTGFETWSEFPEKVILWELA